MLSEFGNLPIIFPTFPWWAFFTQDAHHSKNHSSCLWLQPCCLSISVLISTIYWPSPPHCDVEPSSLWFFTPYQETDAELVLYTSFCSPCAKHVFLRFLLCCSSCLICTCKVTSVFSLKTLLCCSGYKTHQTSKLPVCWKALPIRLINIVLFT